MLYTGKAEQIKPNDRGLAFIVVVKNSDGVVVLHRPQWVSTAAMTGLQAKDAVKNVVERMTQEMWAHIEGGKAAMTYLTEIQDFEATCDHFIPVKNRPDPQSIR